MRLRRLAFVLLIALAAPAAAAGAARAEVVDSGTGGFQVRETVQVKAAPAAVWKAMVEPGRWWDSEHTFSGDAKNMTLEPRAGGCWCEILPNGGSVGHLRVVLVMPGERLNLSGALGPLSFLGAAGALDMKLEKAGAGTKITWTYTVGGYAPGGLDKLAGPVDSVLKAQDERLGRYVETGKP
jgi:uncharacterized protein YndB with AHSA1/START domain